MLSSLLCYQNQVEPQVSEEERKRYEQEFDDYHKKLQDAKTEYDVTTKAFSRTLNVIICFVGKYFLCCSTTTLYILMTMCVLCMS